jgi:hypothetical protein
MYLLDTDVVSTLRHFPVFPVFGSDGYPVQPIYAADLTTGGDIRLSE